MSARFEERRRTIANALDGCAARVTESGPAQWKLAGPGRSKVPAIDVRWDAPWIRFETVANGATPAGPDAGWELLCGQGTLPANCRHALGTGGEMRIVGDVAPEDTADLDARCRETVCGLEAARTERPAPSEPGPDAAPQSACALSEEIGWTTNQRPNGRLFGRLPGVGPARSVELSGDAGDGSRLVVEIATLPPVGDAARQALAEVLLVAGRFVRFARPTVERHDAGSVVRFETRLPAVATAAELRHGLTALAAACDACANEVNVLRDETVAKEYLVVRGESS